MQQILVIHGGDSFNTYEEYLTNLRQKEVSFERLYQRGWKDSMQDNLGSDFQVIAPRMPNNNNARYVEWKIIFEKWLSLVDDGVILVGHSLGGMFLAKYLSEEKCPKEILATFLVAAPYIRTKAIDCGDFVANVSIEGFEKQAGHVYLYHSTDDTIVPFSNAEQYTKAISTLHKRFFNDRWHFIEEEFPEILEDIRSVAKLSF